jgi:hypothetical protein
MQNLHLSRKLSKKSPYLEKLIRCHIKLVDMVADSLPRLFKTTQLQFTSPIEQPKFSTQSRDFETKLTLS